MNNRRSDPSRLQDVAVSPPTRKRRWLIELIVGVVLFVVAFVINRLRPKRPGAADGERSASGTGERYGMSPQTSNPSIVADPDDFPAPPSDYEEITSIWPAVLAAGVTLTAFGVVTNVFFSIFGALIFISGLIGWAGELLRE